MSYSSTNGGYLTNRQIRNRLATNRPSGVISKAGIEIIDRGWNCFVCKRPLTTRQVTLHHLVPAIYENEIFGPDCPLLEKQLRLNKPSCVCFECHRHLHLVFDNAELAYSLNTEEAILDYPGIVEWGENLIGKTPLVFEDMKNNNHELKGYDPTV